MRARRRRCSPATRAVVVVAAALLLAAGCDAADEDAGPPPTTTTTTTTAITTTEPAPSTTTSTPPVPSCPSFGSFEPRSGRAVLSGEQPLALLVNVQAQASACVDEVAFTFHGGLPAYSVGYRSGPTGNELVTRFEPASGVHPEGHAIYDGPTTMRAKAPSGVVELRRLGDSDRVLSWSIELAERRPFEVVARDEQLVVRLAPATPRETRCTEEGGFTVGYPATWFAELSDPWACGSFHREPFVIRPGTDDVRSSVNVERLDVDAASYLDRLATSSGIARQSRSSATVAGRPATVVDIVTDDQQPVPAGFVYRLYVVDAGPRALLISGDPAPDGPAGAQRRAEVDAIAMDVRQG